MRKFLEFSLSFILLFASIRAGWPWPIVFVAAFFAACALGLFSFAEGEKANPNRYLILGAFLSLGLFLSWTIALRLSSLSLVTPSLIESNWLLRVLSGTEATRIFWSVLLGMFLSAVLWALLLLPIAFVGASIMYSANDQYQRHEKEAALNVYLGLLGINKGTWLVSDGKAQIVKGQVKNLQMFGGPGTLIVQEGHAVVLERDGKLSRVVGRGVHQLRSQERVSMVVTLKSRAEQVILEQVATRDRVLIEQFQFWAWHRADQGDPSGRIQDGRFLYNPDIILKKVWKMSGKDWRDGIGSLCQTAARDVIGRYDLEQIVPLSDSFRASFKEALKQQINKVAKELMGIEVTAVDIGQIKIPAEAEDRLLKTWTAQWDQQIDTTRAETEKVVQVTRATARMETVQAIARGLKQLLGPNPKPQDIIALRFIEYLDQRAEASAGLAEDDTAALMRLQSLEALSALRTSHVVEIGPHAE
jgi:regulator of protease activity HflC (stomatin/prohibitin superfamily)